MKKTKNKKKTGRSSETLFSSLKGAIWGVIISVASVLVLAIIVKQGGVANEAISVINQIVKTLSIVVAAFIAVRSAGDKKIQSGVWGGLLYVLLSYGIFSLVEGALGDPLVLLTDAVMGIVIGLLLGIIFGKKQNKAGEKAQSSLRTQTAARAGARRR